MRRAPWHEGDVIHKLRSMHGITAKRLAHLAKLDPAQIYRLENGTTKNPTKSTLIKLGAVFGLTDLEIRKMVPPGIAETKLNPQVDDGRRRKAVGGQ